MRQQFSHTPKYSVDPMTDLTLPDVPTTERTGFVSPARDWAERRLHFNDLLLHPAATFPFQVRGNELVAAGIHDKDYLAIDREAPQRVGDLVLASVDERFVIRRLARQAGRFVLMAEDNTAAPLVLNEANECVFWGTAVLAVRILYQ